MRGLGGVAAARGDAERAGILLGASAAGLLLPHPLLAEARGAAMASEGSLKEARTWVDRADFAADWVVEQAMTELDAIATALSSVNAAVTADGAQ